MCDLSVWLFDWQATGPGCKPASFIQVLPVICHVAVHINILFIATLILINLSYEGNWIQRLVTYRDGSSGPVKPPQPAGVVLLTSIRGRQTSVSSLGQSCASLWALLSGWRGQIQTIVNWFPFNENLKVCFSAAQPRSPLTKLTEI